MLRMANELVVDEAVRLVVAVAQEVVAVDAVLLVVVDAE